MTDSSSSSGSPSNEQESGGVNEEELERLIDSADAGDSEAILQQLQANHPADAADLLENMPRQTLSDTITLLGTGFPASILIEMRDEYRALALDCLPDIAISNALDELDSDDAAIILDDLDDDRRPAVLEPLNSADRIELERALEFDEETAGRLMQREFVAAPEFWSVGHTIDHARASADDLPDTFFEIYVIDPAFRVTGAVPLSLLLRTSRDTALRDISVPIEVEIRPDMDRRKSPTFSRNTI